MERKVQSVEVKVWSVETKPVRGTGAQHMREAMTAEAYGHRPTDSACWWLSPYEFTMHWEVVPARVPYSRAEWEGSDASAWDVRLTAAGEAKLGTCERHAAARLQAGTHYVLASESTPERVLFPKGTATAVLRHNWFLQRRARPRCPHLAAAPVPQGFAENAEKNAKLTQTYFRAWTLDATRATFSVPYAGHLRGKAETWEEALRHWLLQVPAAETKRYVGNFLSVYRVRPAADADANSDDDDVDEPLQLEPTELAKALQTLTPAKRTDAGKAVNDDRAHRVEAALAQADAWWQYRVLAAAAGATGAARGAAGESGGGGAMYATVDSAAAQKAARRRETQSPAPTKNVGTTAVGSVAATTRAADPAVQAWAASLDSHGTCNPEQQAFAKSRTGSRTNCVRRAETTRQRNRCAGFYMAALAQANRIL